METWTKDSWKNYRALQQPMYKDKSRYTGVLKKIATLPALVSVGEIVSCKRQIASACRGECFILQGGDCAERFIDTKEESIINKVKILLQMSVILTYGARKPVVKIGRIAGQYAKPRSNDTEQLGTDVLPVYRGDNINQYTPGFSEREPDPERLLTGYYNSAVSLNYIRSMITGGFADLHHPYNWNIHSIESSWPWNRYRETVDRILDAITFMESFGGVKPEILGKTDFYVSHEGLHLDYEEAMTRRDPQSGKFYNQGAHMLWIGERTRDIEGAHVEYFRGIANPVGVKISSSIDEDELIALVSALNPRNEEGKIVLITRFGSANVEIELPSLIKRINKEKKKVTWSCDPMHGNMIVSEDNRKTRRFEDILNEIEKTFAAHSANESVLSGVHFELTGDDVTECIGGSIDLKDSDLDRNYETYCDPRLNYTQSLEMAILISELLSPSH